MENRILRFRHNAMEISSIRTFENIKGGIHCDCKDVYFVRSLGVCTSLAKEITDMDRALDKLMQEDRCRYKRIKTLPKMSSIEDADYYAGCYEKWLCGGKNTAQAKKLNGDSNFENVLGKACADTLTHFSGSAAGNGSMEKNFIVKLLFWFDWIAEDLLEQWDEKIFVKVVAENVTKKQEYLFFYFLTLLGFDVLLLQTQTDIESDQKALRLSGEFVLGNFAAYEIPAYVKTVRNVDAPSPSHMPQTGSGPSSSQAVGAPVRVHIPPRNRAARPGASAITAASSGAAPLPVSAPAAPIPSPAPVQTAAGTGARRELTFEELARLASSVVMITINDNKGEIIGSGSGIMIGKSGYILTNNHVASGGCTYTVRMENDENLYDTDELIKYNPVLDLAVIRIQKQLAPLPIYNGREPLVRGQKVVAIGSPLGFFNSVSDGIIAGFRTIDMVDMIQFTAPTSPGSSGGALLNMYGEVIGISTAGVQSAQNINLAMGYECINAFAGGFMT